MELAGSGAVHRVRSPGPTSMVSEWCLQIYFMGLTQRGPLQTGLFMWTATTSGQWGAC
jgi:hypothetical protein